MTYKGDVEDGVNKNSCVSGVSYWIKDLQFIVMGKMEENHVYVCVEWEVED